MVASRFRSVLSDTLQVLPALLERSVSQAAQTLEWAVGQAHSKADFGELLERVLLTAPRAFFETQPELVRLFAQVACRAREAETLKTFLTALEGQHFPDLQVYRAWLLTFEGRPAAALEVLQEHPNPQSRYETGLHLRLLGETQAALGQPRAVWHPCFLAARTHLEGGALGICMLTEGAKLYADGAKSLARRTWAEALPLLRQDVFYSAWWHHNLGLTYLYDGEFAEAERHFLELERFAHKPDARSFRSCAHSGLATARRMLGELERAHSGYTRALKLARQGYGDCEDLETALWGVGYTLRLQGRPVEALGYLLEAREVRDARWMLPDLAVCALKLGDLEQARSYLLERPPHLRDRNLHALVTAELARLNGQTDASLEALGTLDFSLVTLSEEVGTFPELFALTAQASLGWVQARTTAPTQVRIQAQGTFRLWVDGREVRLKPTGLPAQLLVLLLEHGGRAALGDLTEALFEERAVHRDKARKALHPHLVTLRQTLGWAGSVQALGGFCQLDPHAGWHYDIEGLRLAKQRPRDFMQGVGRDWVLETLQELNSLPESSALIK